MNVRRLLSSLGLSVFCLAAAAPAFGLANRVFVSQRSGNDANSCDNILTPCQTFAGAVVQLNPGGEAIVLDSGGYGPVTIPLPLAQEEGGGLRVQKSSTRSARRHVASNGLQRTQRRTTTATKAGSLVEIRAVVRRCSIWSSARALTTAMAAWLAAVRTPEAFSVTRTVCSQTTDFSACSE